MADSGQADQFRLHGDVDSGQPGGCPRHRFNRVPQRSDQAPLPEGPDERHSVQQGFSRFLDPQASHVKY
eukprot:7827722-Pyramimonas_sp.AAC.1